MSVLFLTLVTTTRGCMEAERDALLAFKAGILDPSHRLSSWRRPVDCCGWSGVVCDNTTGHVVQLNLQNAEAYYDNSTVLGGEFGPSLLSLTHLRRLNLTQNDFGGARIPKFLGSFGRLRHLDHSWSNFGGAIPPQLGNLSTLRCLSLSSYNLRIDAGDDLQWLSRLSSLTFLQMNFVNLSMASPDWLRAVNQLPSLQQLYLSAACGLTNLDSSLSHVNLTTLATLDLHGNLFNSTFPNWLWKLHNLSYLDLSFSTLHGAISAGIGNLTGPVPTEIGICNSLKLIDLRDNSLFGPIPAGIGNLTGLRKLYLDHNSLFGPIPAEIGNIAGLRELYLDHNSLFGVIPAGIGKLTSLGVLYLNDNSLSGPIPVEIGNLTGLGELYLDENSLSGPAPIEIGKLSNLTILSLSSNSLEGTMSELHFANLTKLSELDLSENSLVISIDHNWVPPFQLRSIKLSSCKLGPTFPRWLRSQNSIKDLDMSNTSIEDALPDWFWNTSSSSINLSQNQISGTLPTSLEHMTHLSGLELSINMLEGPIPRMPPYLSHVNLSSNSFSGPLSAISLTLELGILDLSHNHISGSIPSFICDLRKLVILDLSSNQIWLSSVFALKQ
ncbi:unnamed protein product [Musa acuminata var. zebrina]